jgi:methionyl aminopeptidase
MTIRLKSPREIGQIREAGRIVAECLEIARSMIRPGITTADLDAAIERHIRARGAWPTFKGYRGYPASICVAINNEVVHGIPSPARVLREGDIIGVDIGATLHGYVGDAAATFAVGTIDAEAERLLRVARECLERGIEQARPDRMLLDIGRAVQEHAERHGYSVVRQYCGHGVGRRMHEDPQVPNYVPGPRERAHFQMRLRPGLVLAIEPMVNQGTYEVTTLPDRWTVVTKDGRLSAHFEHTVAITTNGPQILTVL